MTDDPYGLNEPYDPHVNHWFGEPWPSAALRAPVCIDDRYRIPTPVGSPCILCGEVIEADDRGERLSDHSLMHAECGLRNVTGNLHHLEGRCQHVGHCNELSTQTYREEARDVWQAMVIEQRI